jgi:hypothetical protein
LKIQLGTQNSTPRNFKRLQISISPQAELCVHHRGGLLEHILQESKNREVIDGSFVHFILRHNPLNSRSIVRYGHGT